MSEETKPLDDILVVSLEQAVAAPVCTARLAAAGARVIKVERKGGDFARYYDSHVKGECTYFVWANRGKESICLDLKEDDDRAVMLAMLARADVFVENLAQGAAERLGLGPESLQAINPRLITVSISGYGDHGDYAEMRAYDMLVQAESGLSSISGGGRIGVSIADILTGINANGAILEALHQRAKTERGSHIAVSLFDSMADLMAIPLLQTEYSGLAPQYGGMRHPSIVPYGSYPTRSGPDVVIAIQNEREWQRLCEEILERSDLVTDPRSRDNKSRTTNREFIEGVITEFTTGIDYGPLTQRLKEAKIAYGAVNPVEAVLDHPALRRAQVTLPGNKTADLPAPPAHTDWHGEDLGTVPRLDQQGSAIRKEFS
ncbi:CaiB/BaiF CoA transferase family protein [Aestuariispira insulae]|uniref:Crotonobetainyl-CoA:carnitine CoA-transferase CaiB-like acyl-CoA transferase n=1 Tax=Aestuariispira insulae TaxID=1461337 RepID=A0A3D9HGD1_9PROT|nr:CaiB/BaiF CoA-transferase family protein [Aestuariispira insulae]RED48520.1 crotonobetainyl-CoA:carnitine CoA-transferase CaiB-like acyl-CoA transferase [Aestuariispira insulae]